MCMDMPHLNSCPDIYFDSSKHEPALSVDVSNIDVTVIKEDNNEDKEIQLSLSTKELIDGQNNDTFSNSMLKIINDKKKPSDKYFIKDNRLLNKVVKEDDKLFHALVVPVIFYKYILHQVDDALDHNDTARSYQCLKQLHLLERFMQRCQCSCKKLLSADNRICTSVLCTLH